ncbi:MAG: hypothetical protein ACJ74G_06040 [Blastocatellia bacterium]
MPAKQEHITKSKRYFYSVIWSDLDGTFIARVAEFPSLSAHGNDPEAALREIGFVVEAVIEDLEQSGEFIPEPIGSHLRPSSGVEFTARCSISIEDERLIQRGMRETGRSRESVIADALQAGLERRNAEAWTASDEEGEKRKRA